MKQLLRISAKRAGLATIVVGAFVSAQAYGVEPVTAEQVTLTNGFSVICDHREPLGDRVRLYSAPGNDNFVEVPTAEIASIERVTLPEPIRNPADKVAEVTTPAATPTPRPDLTKAELHEMLSGAGARHNLDVNLLAALVRAESGGHSRAISKAGARGLMQLMPRTAADLGVSDSFRPDENIAGGSTYLDSLLTRYHDNLALALAAYNAGPAAVDRYHGVPPYRETRLYVGRIIREFNASVRAQQRTAASRSSLAAASPAPLSGTDRR